MLIKASITAEFGRAKGEAEIPPKGIETPQRLLTEQPFPLSRLNPASLNPGPGALLPQVNS